MSVTPSSDQPDFYGRVSNCMNQKGLSVPARDMLATRDKASETMRRAAEWLLEETEQEIGAAAEEMEFAADPIVLAILAAAGAIPPVRYCVFLTGCLIEAGVPEKRLPRFNIPAEMKPTPEPTMQASPPPPPVAMWPSEPIAPVEMRPLPEPPAAQSSAASSVMAKVGMAVAIMTVLLIAVFMINRPSSNGPSPPATPSASTAAYYYHWNCGGGSQCADDFGADVGVRGPETLAACNNTIQTTMQPYSGGIGAWCDTSDQPLSAP